MNARDQIACRAFVCDECEAGKYRAGWREDGTYRRGSDTVICNPCYVALMPLTPSRQALLHELDDAITLARSRS